MSFQENLLIKENGIGMTCIFTFDLVFLALAPLGSPSGLEGRHIGTPDTGVPLPVGTLALGAFEALERPSPAVVPRVLDHDPAGLALAT